MTGRLEQALADLGTAAAKADAAAGCTDRLGPYGLAALRLVRWALELRLDHEQCGPIRPFIADADDIPAGWRKGDVYAVRCPKHGLLEAPHPVPR